MDGLESMLLAKRVIVKSRKNKKYVCDKNLIAMVLNGVSFCPHLLAVII